MTALRMAADGAHAVVPIDGRWLRSWTRLPVHDRYEERTPAGEEALVLLLGGTVDLFAGGSSWLQRGLRDTPFDGRPCGLYLPPDVGFRAVGRGELLVVRGKRPEPKPDAAPMKVDRASMPLLPLAGSGKAYDSRTGTWEMLEKFPSSPEAVLPRAIVTDVVDGVRVERVFPFAFKAMTLCLDEFVLAPGQSCVVPRPQMPKTARYGEDLALFVRGAAVVDDGERVEVSGDSVVRVRADRPVTVRTAQARAYVAAAWAGDKGA